MSLGGPNPDLLAAQARWPDARVTGFGDGPDLSARLIALIRAGTKTATCSALRDWLAEGEALPEPGAQFIVCDWDGRPELVIEEVAVDIRCFDAVDADFALAEGENADHAGWAADHRAFFERNGGWSPAMELVCERFRMIADLRAG